MGTYKYFSTSNRLNYIDMYPDQLVHWKYVKRIKLSNGKYRYYYDERNLQDLKKQADSAENDVKTAQSKIAGTRMTYHGSKQIESVAKQKLNTAKGLSRVKAYGNLLDVRDDVTKAYADNRTATQKYEKAVRKARKLSKKYEYKKLASFPRRTVAKGIVAAGNYLNNLSRNKNDVGV